MLSDMSCRTALMVSTYNKIRFLDEGAIQGSP